MTGLAAGGADDAPAIDWSGQRLTYRHFRESVDTSSPTPDASSLSVPDALIAVFAAAARGTNVRVVDPVTPPASGTRSDWLTVSTSGSSGNPKPLTRSARSWSDSFPFLTELTGLSSADIVLLTGPLHATMHLFAAVHALSIGACVTDRSDIATATHAVPAALRAVLDRAPKLRTAVVAGIALDPVARERAQDKGIRVVEYYGAAELSLVAARIVPEPLRALPDVNLEIRHGQLWVQSPYAAHDVADDDGWCTAGDLASITADGALTVHGRSDAVVNTGGTIVSAENVEATLGAVPGVDAVAVVGLPHSVLGEIVTAVVQLAPGGNIDRIRALARDALAPAALPRRWIVRESLPRTPSGKIRRAEIRDSVRAEYAS